MFTDNLQPTNEALAIISLLIIAVMAMPMLGAEAKEIVLAIGSGLVGYLSGLSKT